MEPVLNISYTLNEKDAQSAVLQRYFKVARVKTLIYTIILTSLAIYFLIISITAKDRMSAFLSAACVITLIMVYYLPYSQSKMSVGGYKKGARLELLIFSDSAQIIGCDGETSTLSFETLKVISTKNFYCLEDSNRFFPIAKTNLSPEQQIFLQNFFEEKLQNRFKK